MKYSEGDKVYIQFANSNKWSGPAVIISHKNGSVHVHHNGGILM